MSDKRVDGVRVSFNSSTRALGHCTYLPLSMEGFDCKTTELTNTTRKKWCQKGLQATHRHPLNHHFPQTHTRILQRFLFAKILEAMTRLSH